MAKNPNGNPKGIDNLFDLYHIKLTFEEEILGTCGTSDYFKENVLREGEEVDAVNMASSVIAVDSEGGFIPIDERPMTVFARTEAGEPFIFDYLIKGFLKNAAKAFNNIGGDKKLTSYKGKIDGGVFVEPRKLILHLPEGEEIGTCSRPLRASTMQGERVTISKSESAPAGTYIEFWIRIMNPDIKKKFFDYMDYGYYNGLGQWHNSGKGKFSYEILED